MWVSLPDKPQVDRDGTALRDAAGRLKYVAVLEFADARVRNAFSSAALEAIRAAGGEP